MEQFRYVGNEGPQLTVFGIPPKSVEERQHTQISIFSRVFRQEVTAVMLAQPTRLVPHLRLRTQVPAPGPYARLSSQHGAFDRLIEVIEHNHYHLVDVTRASEGRDEFLCRVRVRIPTLPQFDPVLFTNMPDGHKGYMLASFYVGVCQDFTQLLKDTALAETLDQAIQVADPASTTLAETFDPEKVIPGILRSLRATRRYPYAPRDPVRYYQTAEGFFYRVEIEGYATQEVGQPS